MNRRPENMALSKAEKRALVERLLADRMPKLEAVLDSNAAVAEADAAVDTAQQHLGAARATHATTYGEALSAGWTAADLEGAGVPKLGPVRTRRVSTDNAVN
jgi:hypothetical protein